MIRRAYIIQKTEGLSKEEIKADYDRIMNYISLLNMTDLRFINTEAEQEISTPLHSLVRKVNMLLNTDIVIFSKNFHDTDEYEILFNIVDKYHITNLEL